MQLDAERAHARERNVQPVHAAARSCASTNLAAAAVTRARLWASRRRDEDGVCGVALGLWAELPLAATHERPVKRRRASTNGATASRPLLAYAAYVMSRAELGAGSAECADSVLGNAMHVRAAWKPSRVVRSSSPREARLDLSRHGF
eukprot:3805294-Pleurochrysis_carterae.AAC.2